MLSVLGVTTAGLSAGGLFTLLAAARHATWERVAVRVLGSWVAAIGLMMLGFHLR